MLLTSGQISAAISSFIVFIFTSALFLSGYVLQQRTVHNIQAVLHPPPTPTPTTLPPAPAPLSQRRQQILSAFPSSPINWKRTAYAQLVRQHADVCSTIMLFAELTRSQSPAQKALLYPLSWDTELESGGDTSAALKTSVRLLQKAAKQYKVALYPVKPVRETQDLGAAYPLASLLKLTNFDRVLSLLPTGLVLDAGLLDTLFGAEMNSSAMALMGAGMGRPQAAMLRPSMATFQKAVKRRASGERMPGVMGAVELGKSRPWMLSQTSSLRGDVRTGEEGFNSTEWYDMAAYVRFSDGEIPGPEYDVPGRVMAAARPKEGQVRAVWEGVYERFRVERMSVCGLDTVPMPRDVPVVEPDA
ncbi:MAG: hypothetical protein MMC23_005652 [Stictis urceolatum]|nr:hypothetical protein [Stictis urceolata]